MADRVPYHQVQISDQNGAPKIINVPVVQELANQGTAVLPEEFIRKYSSDLVPPSVAPIPVIDMAKIRSDQDREEELRKLATAAKEWGLFLVKNHDIEPEVMKDFQTVIKDFFELSYEEKKASVGTYASRFDNTGYGRNYIQSEDHAQDWHDRLSMRPFPEDATKGLNVWPKNPPNFRPAAKKYVTDARKLCDDLLQAMAESLSADKNAFSKHFDKEKSEVALLVNCYPPCPRPDQALGIAPHTDAAALTVVMEFGNSGGLHVYNFKDQKWVAPVEWPAGELIVVVGDMMQIMSNGEFQSSWHRVAMLDVMRYSVGAFYAPPLDTEIVPINVGNGGYKKVGVGEYLKHFYSVHPSPTKEAFKYAQI